MNRQIFLMKNFILTKKIKNVKKKLQLMIKYSFFQKKWCFICKTMIKLNHTGWYSKSILENHGFNRILS